MKTLKIFAAALVTAAGLATPVLADAESANDDSTGAESFDWIAFALRHEIHPDDRVNVTQDLDRRGDRFLILLDRDSTESLSNPVS